MLLKVAVALLQSASARIEVRAGGLSPRSHTILRLSHGRRHRQAIRCSTELLMFLKSHGQQLDDLAPMFRVSANMLHHG